MSGRRTIDGFTTSGGTASRVGLLARALHRPERWCNHLLTSALPSSLDCNHALHVWRKASQCGLEATAAWLWLRRLLPVRLFAGGAWWCARLLGRAGAAASLQACRAAGPWIGLVPLAPLVGDFLHRLGWRALLPRTAQPRMFKAFRIFYAAQAGNELAFGLLGESAKIAFLPASERSAAVRAVVLDNLAALVALLAFFVTVAAMMWSAIPAAGPSRKWPSSSQS